MTTQEIVRPPAVAGMFYDDSPVTLQKYIDTFLAQVKNPPLQGKLQGIVSPHAGYVYSGLTAAHAYKLLEGKHYECVFLVGPSHREYFDRISIYSGDAYETPLGKVSIHKEIRSALAKELNTIIVSSSGHRSEHSLEVQLPFLQRVLGDFSFVPIIMGDQRRQLCDQLADAIVRTAGQKDILLVASSDLSHYHPSREARLLDNRVIQEVENFDADAFLDKLEEESFEACGGGPIAVVMRAAHQLGANKAKVLHYCNSGDITGDNSAVVGYLAAAFLQVN